MNQTLEDRLTNLELQMPPDLVPNVLARAQHPRRGGQLSRLLLAPALALAILLIMLAGSLYFAPRFGDVLASAPVIGGPTGALLQSIGLGPIGSKLTPLNDVAVSSGYRVQLIAGYADLTQTILVLRVSPPAGVFSSPVLKDQFGRTLDVRGATYDLRNGTTVVSVQGLPWPDQLLGARVTLQLSLLQPNPDSTVGVMGSWTLHATLGVEPGRTLAAPADAQIATTTFHFTSIVRSGPSLEVDMRVSGPLATHLTDMVGQAIPYVAKPHQALNITLVDAHGTQIQALNAEVNSGQSPATLRWQWLVTAPGHYRMVVSIEGAGQFEREIVVP